MPLIDNLKQYNVFSPAIQTRLDEMHLDDDEEEKYLDILSMLSKTTLLTPNVALDLLVDERLFDSMHTCLTALNITQNLIQKHLTLILNHPDSMPFLINQLIGYHFPVKDSVDKAAALLDQFSYSALENAFDIFNKSELPLNKKTIKTLDHLSQLFSNELIALIYARRHFDWLNEEYLDTFGTDDAITLIGFANNDIDINLRVELTFNFLKDFKTWTQAQPLTPALDIDDVKVYVHDEVENHCKTHLKSLHTAKEYDGFLSFMQQLKEKGPRFIWPEIQDTVVYHLEASDEWYTQKTLKQLRDFAKEGMTISLKDLDLTQDMQDSKAYQAYCTSVISKRGTGVLQGYTPDKQVARDDVDASHSAGRHVTHNV